MTDDGRRRGDRKDGPPEARPVEAGPPSDLMSALVAGIEDAAATGRGLAGQLEALETSVACAHRRRTMLIVTTALTAFFVALQGSAFLRLELASREERRLLLECSTPSMPGDVHECYEDVERRTAEAVAVVGARSMAVGQCVVDRARDVRICVEQIPSTPPRGAP